MIEIYFSDEKGTSFIEIFILDWRNPKIISILNEIDVFHYILSVISFF